MKKLPSFRAYDRSFFSLLGMAFSLALILSAFQWQVEGPTPPSLRSSFHEIDQAEIEIVQFRLPTPQAVRAKVPDVDGSVEPIENPALEPTEIVFESVPLPDLPIEIDTTVDLFVPLGEHYPIFPGGDEALLTYLSKNTRYTSLGRTYGIQGIVYLHFIVQSDGSIAQVTVLRGLGYGLDEEAIRVVQNMPRWQPGYQGGKAVHVAYTLPIRFSLR